MYLYKDYKNKYQQKIKMATYRHLRDFILQECTKMFRPFTSSSIPIDTIYVSQTAVANPLCAKCLHYKPGNIYGVAVVDNRMGYCRRSARIDIAKESPTYGSITYDPVQKYYLNSCKGDMYEEIPPKKSPFTPT